MLYSLYICVGLPRATELVSMLRWKEINPPWLVLSELILGLNHYFFTQCLKLSHWQPILESCLRLKLQTIVYNFSGAAFILFLKSRLFHCLQSSAVSPILKDAPKIDLLFFNHPYLLQGRERWKRLQRGRCLRWLALRCQTIPKFLGKFGRY